MLAFLVPEEGPSFLEPNSSSSYSSTSWLPLATILILLNKGSQFCSLDFAKSESKKYTDEKKKKIEILRTGIEKPFCVWLARK